MNSGFYLRLDQFENELGEKNIDLVKIDIEGHERKALQGLREEGRAKKAFNPFQKRLR